MQVLSRIKHSNCISSCNVYACPSCFSYRMAMESHNYAAVPWETDSVDYVIADVQQSMRTLRRVVPGSQSAIMLKEHYTWSAVAAIFFSNRIEDVGVTLSDTFTLCSDRLTGSVSSESMDPTLTMQRREAVQHAEAFQLLHEHMVVQRLPLTTAIICDAHAVLMRDCVRGDGVCVKPGQYRERKCFAGYHTFLPHTCIKRCLSSLVDDYNERSSDSDSFDPFESAAWLSYEFVSIHPYDDGNGRMCRMLLNMVLLRSDVPFAVAMGFSSAHKKAKAQYFQCIMNARARGGRATRLAFVVLCAFRDVAASFLENVRIAYPEEFEAMNDGAQQG